MPSETPEAPRWPVWERPLLVAVSAALIVGFGARAGAANAPPFGEDAVFWGARAVFLAHGDINGGHPPLYPALAALLHLLSGLSTLRAAQVLALVAGAALPAAMATLGAQLGGLKAGRWAGWLTLGLPTLLAWSTRVEPTSTLALAVVLLAIGLQRVAARETDGIGASLGLGVLAGMLTGFKETGGVFGGLLIALYAGVMWNTSTGARKRRAGAAALGLGLGVAALTVFAAVGQPPDGLGGRVVMPVQQAWDLVVNGRAVNALASPDVPGWIVPRPVRAVLGPHGGSAWMRAGGFAALQVVRTVAMIGPWVLGIAVTLWVGLRGGLGAAATAAPAACFGRWLPITVLAAGMPLYFMVFQARHIELAVLGAVLGVAQWLAKGLGTGGVGGQWLAGGTALVLAWGWTGLRLSTVEVARAGFAVTCARDQQASLERVGPLLPEGAAVCSDEPWIHVRDDAPVYPCDDVPDGWRITGPGRAPGPGAISLGKGACTGPLFLVPPTGAAPAAR